MTFARCGIPIHSPGPCTIDRGCYNATECMRVKYWKPAWTKALLRPDTIVLQHAPEIYHPVRLLFRPEVTTVEVKLPPKFFLFPEFNHYVLKSIPDIIAFY